MSLSSPPSSRSGHTPYNDVEGEAPSGECGTLLEAHRREVTHRLEDLERSRGTIDAKIANYRMSPTVASSRLRGRYRKKRELRRRKK